jgi:ubiquinone/menaquinone biosynthesis C-methylase UbiE
VRRRRDIHAPNRGPAAPERPRASDQPWDEVATWYDALVGDEGSEYHQKVIVPGILRLLELRPGERALDLACGQGVLSRALFKQGAEVTGVDSSPRLLQMARQRSPRGIRYLQADARALNGLADASFDAIACALAIQNIDPLEPVLSGCARLLRPGGRLVLVMNHPTFRIPRQSRWGWDEARRLMYRAVDRYLSPLRIPIDTRPFKAPGQFTWTYHRPLQDYVKALTSAGLLVDALEEWPSDRKSVV